VKHVSKFNEAEKCTQKPTDSRKYLICHVKLINHFLPLHVQSPLILQVQPSSILD